MIIANQTSQIGTQLDTLATKRRERASLGTTLHDQPRVSRHINDNYCVNDPVCAQRLTKSDFKYTPSCCKSCTFCYKVATKRDTSPDIVLKSH